MNWTDEDERLLRTCRRKWNDVGLTPYTEMRRWRRAFWMATTVAGVQAVALWAILSNWMLACK